MIYVLVFKRKSIINVDKEIYFYPSQLNQLIVMSIFPSVVHSLVKQLSEDRSKSQLVLLRRQGILLVVLVLFSLRVYPGMPTKGSNHEYLIFPFSPNSFGFVGPVGKII